MTLFCNPAAVHWTTNNAPGVRCREDQNGQMYLSDWPSVLGPQPTQGDLDQWDVDWQARDIAEEEYTRINNNKLLKALALVCADQFGMTPAQLKTAIKAKL